MLISAYWDNSFDVDTKAAFLLCNANESEKQEECNRDKPQIMSLKMRLSVVNAFFLFYFYF